MTNTKYILTTLPALSERQKTQIAKCAKAKKACTLKLSMSQIFQNSNDKLLLTHRQVESLKNAKNKHKPLSLTLSASQLQSSQKGGLLPLIPLLVAGAKVLGTAAAGAAASTAASKLVEKLSSKFMGKGIVNNLRVDRSDVRSMVTLVERLEEGGILPKGSTEFSVSRLNESKGDFILPLVGCLACKLDSNIGEGLKHPWDGQGFKKSSR